MAAYLIIPLGISELIFQVIEENLTSWRARHIIHHTRSFSSTAYFPSSIVRSSLYLIYFEYSFDESIRKLEYWPNLRYSPARLAKEIRPELEPVHSPRSYAF